MKAQSTKNIKTQRINKRTRSTSHAVILANTKWVGLRHFRLVEHKHTGKLIHYWHTSHLALVMILIFIGFFLLIGDNAVRAIADSGSVSISATVPDNGQVTVPDETKTSNVIWFITPVPLYIVAVAMTLGFWGGDIFDRRFGSCKPQHRKPRKV